MAEYTLADPVADRDEAYRLLHAAQVRLERLERLDDYERGYRDGSAALTGSMPASV